MTPTDKAVAVDPETGEIVTDPFEAIMDAAKLAQPTSQTDFGEDGFADFSALLNLVDRDIAGWRPEPGDRLFGTVVDITEGTSEFGAYPLLVIDTPQSRTLVGVHCFHASLKRDVESAMTRLTLVVGSRVAIGYRGEGEAQKGKSAPNIYRLAVLPPAAK